MIRYLRHDQIDPEKWDDCISKAMNRRVFGFSWYLDHICTGWDALVEDDYLRVFPLTHNRKWGISYLYQPYFAQQLGLFSQIPVDGAVMRSFIDAIPGHYRLVEIQLNQFNDVRLPSELTDRNHNKKPGPAPGLSGNHHVDEPGLPPGLFSYRRNHELDLHDTYEALSARYSQNTRRNIRKAIDHGIEFGERASVKDLVELFRNNFGKTENKLRPHHYDIVQGLLEDCLHREQGEIFTSSAPDGKLMAAAFLLQDADRVYFLFAASDARARDNGAMFLLVDHCLRLFSGSARTFDFEGGNEPSLARFYKSFGATETNYPVLRINRLPLPVKLILSLVRKWKGL